MIILKGPILYPILRAKKMKVMLCCTFYMFARQKQRSSEVISEGFTNEHLARGDVTYLRNLREVSVRYECPL